MKKLRKTSKKIVVKVGSSLLTGGGTRIVRANLARIVRHVAGFITDGHRVILVTSGAIASGLSVLGLAKKPKDLAQLQAAAAAGQAILMHAYAAAFAKYKIRCGQILITKEDFDDNQRRENARHTVNTLLDFGIVPIFNENDAVSVDEIKFGDNDTLSAHVALAVEADGLLILTGIDGWYSQFDLKTKKCSGLMKEIADITAEIESASVGTDSAVCIGGMSTKIAAAKIATGGGIPVIIANGFKKNLQISFSADTYDDYDGTRFPAGCPRGSRI